MKSSYSLKKRYETIVLLLGYGESNPGLLRDQTLLGSESQRCYRYTIPDFAKPGWLPMILLRVWWGSPSYQGKMVVGFRVGFVMWIILNFW